MFGQDVCQANFLDQNDWMSEENLTKLQIFRHGITGWLRRTVNRAFQFIRLRRCCDQGHVFLAGILTRHHRHGMREYYDDEAYARLFPGDDRRGVL